MQETYDVVDKNDKVIKTWLLKEELHVNNDITRVVTIHVCDSQWKYYIAQRSPDKIVDPLLFEAPAHGRVSSGEDYDAAAKREVQEELGIDEIELQEIGYFYMEFESNMWTRRHWEKLYIWKCETLWEYSKDEIYSLKSFDTLKELVAYYRYNTWEFSNAAAFSMPYIEKYSLT